MTRTHPRLPALVPAPLVQWAHDFVHACYVERLRRAGGPNDEGCELCGARPHPDASIEDACQTCGHVEARAAEMRAAERARVLVPCAVPTIDDETIPW